MINIIKNTKSFVNIK